MTTENQAKMLAGMILKFSAQLRETEFMDSGVALMAEGLVDEMEVTVTEMRAAWPAIFGASESEGARRWEGPSECPHCETGINWWDSCCPECGYEIPGRF